MITIQSYVRAASIDEAYELNQKRGSCIIGGMLWTKMSRANYQTAIDISGLGLDSITETDEEFVIGAMVSLRQLETHAGINQYCDGAVKNALKDIVGVQFRNLATIGGSLWGRFGFSDVLTVFMAMDSYVELYKGGIIPLKEFAAMKYDRDLLIRVIVKKTPGKYVYYAVRNQSTDFPVIACAAALVNDEIRFVAGARPQRAMLIRDEQQLLADGITEESAETFAKWAAAKIPTDSNNRAGAEYRSRLIETLCRRLLINLKD